MDAIQIFAINIAASLILSLIVVAYLRNVLKELLDTACPNAGSRFWINTLSLLQFFAPLLLVIWRADFQSYTSAAQELKSALSWMLLGHCIALLLLARIVWQTMVRPAMNAQNKSPA